MRALAYRYKQTSWPIVVLCDLKVGLLGLDALAWLRNREHFISKYNIAFLDIQDLNKREESNLKN